MLLNLNLFGSNSNIKIYLMHWKINPITAYNAKETVLSAHTRSGLFGPSVVDHEVISGSQCPTPSVLYNRTDSFKSPEATRPTAISPTRLGWVPVTLWVQVEPIWGNWCNPNGSIHRTRWKCCFSKYLGRSNVGGTWSH